MVAQFLCEETWAKGSVSANIDASEKNYESHYEIMKERDRKEGAKLIA